MFSGLPSDYEFGCATRTTSGTMITIPAGKWYTGDVSISASASVLGASNPVVTVNGTNVAPPAGTVIARLNINGLALTTVSDCMTIPVIIRSPLENSVTVDFTAGATGTSSATINGFFF